MEKEKKSIIFGDIWWQGYMSEMRPISESDNIKYAKRFRNNVRPKLKKPYGATHFYFMWIL